ncbi:MAG: Fe-S cluster assembly protein SufD [Candidatus Aminicenantes bacterium]|jgi:Fe-S cluster assembly protein SufD
MFEGVQQSLSLLGSYDNIKKERWARSPLWLTALREYGRDLFEQRGLPQRRQEEWKYTDVSALARQHFAAPVSASSALTGKLLKEQNLREYLLPSFVPPLRLVFVNGVYSPSLSRCGVQQLPKGVEIRNLGAAINRNPLLVQNHLANYAKPDRDSFVALNNAFIEEGAWILIPKGVHLLEPVHLVYITTGKGKARSCHPRNLVVVETGAKVSIIEEYIGDNDELYFNNPVTEISIHEGAEVDHYKVQRESARAFHIATIEARQENDSRFVSHNLNFGAQLTRNNIHAHLTGSGSSCTLNGLFMIEDTQHVDNHTLIHHGAPDCQSSELYHGILDDKARGVFNGKIYVEAVAQKTDSQQTSRSLMLSNDAVIDAKPQLEIFADDVKCTHGAAVGKIDDDSLHYMRSRGISDDEARKILTLGFARQITQRFELEPLKKAIGAFLAKRLGEN